METETPALQAPQADTSIWHCESCGCAAPDLVVLPSCGHRFCVPCVDQWLWMWLAAHGGGANGGGNYPCQQCKEPYRLPPDGLNAFLQNIHVLRLQEQLEQLNMTSASRCNSGVVATGERSDREAVDVQGAQNETIDMQGVLGNEQDLKVGGGVTCAVTNIMTDVGAAQSGQYSPLDAGLHPTRTPCALVPYVGYCRIPNHMF